MLKKTFKAMQMTKVAIWCRHEADNLIGIGDDIPWHIPSDSRFFADVIAGQDVVLGRLSLIHLSEPTRLRRLSYAVFCLTKQST